MKDPGAIHFIVPQLCPKDSGIYRQFAYGSYGPHIRGISDNEWDDCVSYISHGEIPATCLASGGERFAIGMRSGIVKIYDQSSCQICLALDHEEIVRLIRFDAVSSQIVTCGYELVKLWRSDGTLLWSRTVKESIMALSFLPIEKTILALDRGSNIVRFTIEDGLPQSPTAADISSNTARRKLWQVVTTADICPEKKLIALAYRGRPA